jgi:hypothetical protein
MNLVANETLFEMENDVKAVYSKSTRRRKVCEGEGEASSKVQRTVERLFIHFFKRF